MKHVTWKTSLIALGISAVGTLGLSCVLLYLGCVAFGVAVLGAFFLCMGMGD